VLFRSISQNGDNQFLINSVTNDYRANSALGDGLTAAEITKFNAFSAKSGVSDTDRTNYYKMLLNNPSDALLTAFESMFNTGGKYSLAKSNLLSSLAGSTSLKTTGTDQTQFLANFNAMTDVNTEQSTAILNLINHQDTATPTTLKANGDYLDIFYKNLTSNITTASTLVDIIKAPDSTTRTRYIDSINAISQIGDYQFLINSVRNDYRANSALGDGLTAAEITKFNTFSAKSGVSDADRTNYYKILLNNPRDTILSAFESMFDTGGNYSLNKYTLLSSLTGSTSLRTAGTDQTQFLTNFKALTDVSAAQSTAILNLINHQDTAPSARDRKSTR